MINVSDKTKKYLDMMENKFNRVDFYEFVKDLLNLENKDISYYYKLEELTYF